VPAAWLAPDVASVCDRWMSTTSTGPMSPLVIAFTTCGDALECIFTTRAYGYSPEQIDAILAAFRGRLAGPCHSEASC